MTSNFQKQTYGGVKDEKVDKIIDSSTSDGPILPDDFGFTAEEKKKIMRRMDLRIVTTLGAMYCVSVLDRANLSSASIAGMDLDLHLGINNRYSIVSLVFFITYILFQPPSTIMVRRFGPRAHLSLITTLWGATMIGMGFVSDWGAMVGLRLLIGFLEAGFFPSSVYLLSMWYTRYEVGRRYSLFLIIGIVAGAFGGIFAFGLMHMSGIAGLAGWRWIFIIEGIVTCVLGVAGYWFLVNFPDSKRHNWSFLDERERAWVVARIELDRGDTVEQPFSWAKWLGGGADVKIWLYAFLFLSSASINYALAYFLPIILNLSLGFDVGTAQCLVAPPYVFAGIVMYAGASVGDRYHVRGPIIVFNMLLCLVGLPLLGFHPHAAVRYFGIFMCTAGSVANIPVVMAWQANNIRGHWKRAFCSATLVAAGGIGGIVGSTVFRGQDKPTYHPGLWVCIGLSLCSIVIVGILTLMFRRENRKADRGEKELECPEGDEFQKGFRYTY